MSRVSRFVPILLSSFALSLVACGDAAAPPSDEEVGDADTDTQQETDGDDTPQAEIPDGAETDTGPGETVERIDWSVERGPALDTVEVPLGPRRLIAAHADGVVAFSDCQVDVGCDFAWFDLDGAITRALDDRMAIYGTALDPGARWLHLFAAEQVEACGPGPSFATVVSGTLELIALDTGALAYGETMRSNVFLDPAFSTTGRWFHAMTVPDGQCAYEYERWRATSPPHGPPAFSDPDFWLAIELADGRWAGWSGTRFGVADPRVAESFVALGSDIDGFLVGGGWLHGLGGYGDLTEVIAAVGPDGTRWTLTLPDDGDYRGQAAWGPAVLACTSRGAERGVRECAVFDVTGETPRRDLVVHAARMRSATFVGDGAAIVFESLAAELPTLERLDLASGAHTRLATGSGTLHPLGLGEAALWRDEHGVWLIERAAFELLVGGEIAQLLVAPPAFGAPPGLSGVRQRSIASIVSRGPGDHFRHAIFDLRTRRLASTSERLYFTPHPEQPLAADDCGEPWVMRSAGGVGDGFTQDARWLHFAETTETGGELSLWVVPIDLSTPPRRLATSPPERCHAPLASPEGELIGVALDDEGGATTRVLVARP